MEAWEIGERDVTGKEQHHLPDAHNAMKKMPSSFKHASFGGLIGIAQADITPPIGIYLRNWGAAKHDTADGVHRPLTLTALTLQLNTQSKPLVLIDLDASNWRSIAVEQELRQNVLEALGIDRSRLLIGLTHSHSAPALTEFDPAWEGGDLLHAHLQTVQQAAIDATRRALQSATQATLDWNVGRCGLATNRDLRDPDEDRIISGFNPSAEADDTLVVGRVTDTAGKIIATIVNYACHPTTLAWENTLISPDFVGAMRETIAANSSGAPAMFLQGASGELAPRYQYVGDVTVADTHGRQLAYSALAALEDMEPAGMELTYGGLVESGAPLAVWNRTPCAASTNLQALNRSVELPLKNWPSADQLENERQSCTERTTEERLRRKRDIRRVLGDGKTFSMPFWVWRIGDAFLVGCMMEAYSWMQRHLRQRFPDNTIIYANLVNGSIGYLPPAKMYAVEVYQVWQTPFERGSLEILAKAYEEAIESLL
jgi:Neutral/alkaline non-lysosomal ceramidase, N-terminal